MNNINNLFKLAGSIIVKDEASKTIDNVEKKLDGAESKLSKVGDSFGKLGGKLSSAGKGLSKNVTAPIVGIGVAAMASYKEVDEVYDAIAKGTGATGESLDGLKDSFKNVAKVVPADMDQIASAVADLNTHFGLTGDILEDRSEQFLKFANISDADVTDSVMGAKQSMEAFNLELEDLDNILDTVAYTAQATGMSTDQIFDSVVKGAPQLQALGLGFEESAMLMGQFEQKGVDGTRALSYLTRAQVDLAKEGKTLEEGLADLMTNLDGASSETEKLEIAAEMFGTKGASVMIEAAERGALNFEELGISAEQVAGTVGSTFEEVIDPADKFKTTMNNAKIAGAELGAEIFEVLGPILDNLVEIIGKATEWFSKLSPHTKKMIVIFGGIAAALGPVLIFIGSLISAIGKIMPLIKLVGVAIGGISLPVVAVVAAIAALIAIGVALWKNWDKVKEVAGNVFGWIKDFIVNAFEIITGAIGNALDWITENVGGTFGDVAEAVKEYLNMAWENIKLVWDFIKETFSNALELIKALVSGDFEGMKDIIKEQLENAKELIFNIWENIKEFFGGKLSEILEDLKEKFHDMFLAIGEKLGLSEEFIEQTWDYIKGYFQNVLNFLKALVSGDFEGMKNSISNAMSSAKEFLSNIWEEIKLQFSNKINEILGNVREKFKEIKDKILSPIEDAKNKVKQIVEDIKGFFSNMKIRIPDIPSPKMPKMPEWVGNTASAVRGSKLNPVNWNAEGGIFDSPTIFKTDRGLQGVGEAGPEAIMPLDKLRNWIGEWMGASSDNRDVVHAIDRIGGAVKDSARKENSTSSQEYNVTINMDGTWVVDTDERAQDVINEMDNRFEKILRSRGEK